MMYPNPMMQPMANPMMNPYAAGMSGYLQNLDTELDYYHSDGRTDFKGNRNTRTYIKDVSMGRGSTTSFGLLNLDVDLSDDEDKNSIDLSEKSDDELDLEDLMVNCAVYEDHPL